MQVTIDNQGLVLGDQSLPVLSGSIHYWRHAAKDWPALIDRIVELGFRLICSYVPWSVHEDTPGTFDFGDLDPSKDVGRFLDLAHSRGLLAMVRPGPHINAEITYFGYPKRLFEDNRFLARNARGGPVILPALPRAFPVISYASEAFWAELAGWFDAVAPKLVERLYPRGPIVAVQLDNELSYFFRTAPYDQDYHPDMRAKWLAWLKEKYGDERRAADAFNSSALPSELPLPDAFHIQSPRDLPFYLDWMAFREEFIGRCLARLKTMWERREVTGVPFFHNFPVGEAKTPFNIPHVEQTVDFCGIDFYMQKKDYRLLKRRMLFLSGQSRLPVSPEFASGCYQLWPTIDRHDQEFTIKTAWMHGLKGVNFYMLVERERWYGSPITRTGAVRHDYWEFFRRHLGLLERLRPWELRRRAPVCILSVREYERFEAATNALSPLTPAVMESLLPTEDLCLEANFGFSRPIQWMYAKMMRGWEHALDTLGIPYVIGSTDMDAEEFKRFDAVICPTFEFLSHRAQRLLEVYATGGGTVICGPEVPALDEDIRDFSLLNSYTGRPVERLETEVDVLICPAIEGRFVLVTDVGPAPADTLPLARVICRRFNLEPVYPTTGPCETSLHEGADRRVLYVANPTAVAQRPRIRTALATESFVDLENGDRFHGVGHVEIDLPPYAIRILEVK